MRNADGRIAKKQKAVSDIESMTDEIKLLAKELGAGDLPSELTESMATDETFLKKLHHILLEVRLIEGALVCPESGRKFPVKNSIPNMLLNEDEV